jgi:hypothetical protein
MAHVQTETLRLHASVSLVVASKLPRRAEPGDHDALVLLSTRPLRNARLAVRLRMGVVVVVRAPGKVVRRLELRGLRVARRGKRRALDLVVANRGNVTESLKRARVVVSRTRTGQHVATLGAITRDLRPRTTGILEFPLRRRKRGWMTVRAGDPRRRRTQRSAPDVPDSALTTKVDLRQPETTSRSIRGP